MSSDADDGGGGWGVWEGVRDVDVDVVVEKKGRGDGRTRGFSGHREVVGRWEIC